MTMARTPRVSDAERRSLSPDVKHLALMLIILFPLFALNGRWGVEANLDAIAAAAPAWHLVEEGSLDLTAYAAQNPWFVPDQYGRYVSDRPPGLIAAAIPGYALWQQSSFSNAPATMVALIATLGAVVLIWWLSRRVVGRSWALIGTLVFALGTTTWAISSAQLWPHGIGQLAAAVTLFGLAGGRQLTAGLAGWVAVVVRPITAVYVVVTGVAESWRRGDRRVVLVLGSAAMLAGLTVLIYYRWLFAEWTLSGGHNSGLTGGFSLPQGPLPYLENLASMFFSMRNGLFVLSPVVLVASYGAIRHRKSVPGWAGTAALAGVAYLLVHAAFNRASGGAPLFYRYPLEALALASVALLVGAKSIYQESTFGRLITVGAATISVLLQFANVFYLSCLLASPGVPACALF